MIDGEESHVSRKGEVTLRDCDSVGYLNACFLTRVLLPVKSILSNLSI